MASESLNIPALQAFAKAIKKDPQILFSKDLEFLRIALSIYGDLKLPRSHDHDHREHDHEHGHDHAHGDSCAHGHDDAHKHGDGCAHGHDDNHDHKDHDHKHEHEHHQHNDTTGGHAHEHHAEEEDIEEPDDEVMVADTDPCLAVPAGGEDWEGAAAAKDQAADAKMAGDYAAAVNFYTESMTKGQASALSLANRADCLLKDRRPVAAIADCTAALELNPDSAKALRCRGRAHRHLGHWEQASADLAAAQRIDFDPDVEPVLKLVCARVGKIEARRTKERVRQEERNRVLLQKRRAEIEEAKRRAKEEEARRAASMEDEDEDDPAGFGGQGMPGFGGGGGGGGAGMQQMLMQLLMSDPELAAGMKNPKLMKAFMAAMTGGPDAAAMQDPECQAFMTKVMNKLGPLMGMMGGGMPGGMPGGPPGRDHHGHSHDHGHGEAEELDDDIDMPDLE